MWLRQRLRNPRQGITRVGSGTGQLGTWFWSRPRPRVRARLGVRRGLWAPSLDRKGRGRRRGCAAGTLRPEPSAQVTPHKGPGREGGGSGRRRGRGRSSHPRRLTPAGSDSPFTSERGAQGEGRFRRGPAKVGGWSTGPPAESAVGAGGARPSAAAGNAGPAGSPSPGRSRQRTEVPGLRPDGRSPGAQTARRGPEGQEGPPWDPGGNSEFFPRIKQELLCLLSLQECSED